MTETARPDPTAPARGHRRGRRERRVDAARRRVRAFGHRFDPLVRTARPVTDFVSPLGFLVVAVTIAAFAAGVVGHWAEFVLVGYGLLAVLLCCVVLAIGRTELDVALEVAPLRLGVGDVASGRLVVRNLRRGTMSPIALELPVGLTTARFTLPRLAGGAVHEERFTIPTVRRGVITVGPATTVRGDPFGLLHRTVRWTGSTELFVHPRLVRVSALDSGVLRDLEGRTTNDMSVSDLAFHALRDYVPGDDRRYIHWRSSARASAGAGTTELLVRQFLDTRRSHLCVVVDADDLAYPDPADFEIALSAAASVAVRALRDEVRTTVLVADQLVPDATPQRALDAFARADPLRRPVSRVAADAARVAPETSVALLVTGANADYADLHGAAANFGVDVRVVALRVDPEQPVGVSSVGGVAVLSVGELGDVARVLAARGAS